MNNNDTKVNEQKELVIEGTILADHFKHRSTGKDVGDDTTEINSLKARVEALEGIIDLFFEYNETTQVLKFKKEVECSKIHINKISNIVDEDGRTIIPDSEPNKTIVGGSDFVYHLETFPTE